MKIDLEGRLVESSPHRVNPAGFTLQSAIHTGVEGAHCGMHTHTTAGCAVAGSAAGLSMDNFYAAQLHGRLAYHDFEGITIHAEEGPRVVRSIGNRPAVILRNHGLLAWGGTIPFAFAMLWTLQRACEIQVAGAALGPTLPIPEAVQRQASSDGCSSILAMAAGRTYSMPSCGAWTRPIRPGATRRYAPSQKTPDKVLEEVARICAMRHASRSPTLVEAGISTAYGCTLQGQVGPSEVERLAQAVLHVGADRVSLGDTVGYADPAVLKRLFERLMHAVGERLDSAHSHHMGGFELANAATALGRYPPLRRVHRRHWRISALALRKRQCRNRGSRLHARKLGLRYRPRHRGLLALRAEVAEWLRGEPMHGVLWHVGLPGSMRDAGAARLPAEDCAYRRRS